MSKRPQNGPTFSKAPAKKRKPMTDDELAESQRRKDAAHAEMVQRAEHSRNFRKRLREDTVGFIRAFTLLKKPP